MQDALPENSQYETGMLNGNTIMLMLHMDEKTQKIGIFREQNDQWKLLCWSAPLPPIRTAVATLGSASENKFYLFYHEESLCYTFQEKSDGKWRLMYLQGQDNVTFIENGCWLETDQGVRHCYGTVNWPELTTIDKSTLPTTFDEAYAMMDRDGWAVVNNPKPEDRLHLRASASKDAASLGKFYTGTPVKVLETQGEWAQVDAFGVRGYMMKKYLATGQDAEMIPTAFPSLAMMEYAAQRGLDVYKAPDIRASITGRVYGWNGNTLQMFIIGVAGDDWLIMFTLNGQHGYIRSEYFMPINQ